MNHLSVEITAFTRACERLLSQEGTLNEDERSLLEYYVNDLSREFLSDKPTLRTRSQESGASESSSQA